MSTMRGQIDSQIEKIQNQHHLEIEELRRDYEKRLDEAVERVRREVNTNAERRIEEIRHQYEQDLNDSSPDSSISVVDLGQKLKEEIKLTQELDSRLIGALKKGDKKSTILTNDSIPNKLKQLLEKVDKEGVLLLSLSELLLLKTHLNQKANQNNSNAMNKILNAAYENEKDQLMKQIYQLKELVAKMNDVSDILESNTHTPNPLKSPSFQPNVLNNAKDWRGDLIRAVASVFKEEQESLLAELRSFVTASSHLDENKVTFFENKVKAQVRETYESFCFL